MVDFTKRDFQMFASGAVVGFVVVILYLEHEKSERARRMSIDHDIINPVQPITKNGKPI